MSPAVDLSSEEIAQIKEITRLQDDSAAVSKAAREYLRLSRLRELKAACDKVVYDALSAQRESFSPARSQADQNAGSQVPTVVQPAIGVRANTWRRPSSCGFSSAGRKPRIATHEPQLYP